MANFRVTYRIPPGLALVTAKRDNSTQIGKRER